MSNLGFDKNRFREAMGEMSTSELAERLGCGKSSVSMYLAGQREPSKMAVQLIALILGVNPAWLCGMDVPKYSNAKIISKTISRPTFADVIELEEVLPPDEAQFIELYRLADEIDKQTIRNILSRYDEKRSTAQSSIV